MQIKIEDDRMFAALRRVTSREIPIDSLDKVNKLIGSFAKEMGINHYICGSVKGPDSLKEWALFGDNADLWIVRDIHRLLFANTRWPARPGRQMSGAWSDLMKQLPAPEKGREPIQDAWEGNQMHGVIIPIVMSDTDVSMAVFAGESFPVNRGIEGVLDTAAWEAHRLAWKLLNVRQSIAAGMTH